MDDIASLVAFGFLSSVTPGPNNVLLWASGARFGLRRTLPHVLVSALGLGMLAVAVAAGLGALVVSLPWLATVMKLAGSAYLVWLAIQVARSTTMDGADLDRPLGLVGAILFQAVNPKAWIFALGAMSTFRPDDLPVLAGSGAVVVAMMLVVLPAAALWAAAGGVLARLITGPRTHRAVSLVLGLLLLATVVSVWL